MLNTHITEKSILPKTLFIGPRLYMNHNTTKRTLSVSKIYYTIIIFSNNFPLNTILKLPNCYTIKKSTTSPSPNSPQSPTTPFIYKSIPYIPILSDNIRKFLKSTITNLSLGLRSHNKLSFLFTN
ncbi:unnamed protein product [Nezara viridula]|uniref:Uncharacterized protein n=1 Tax=Nezara viridula TaxID=85310 RepID=A0A9P0ECS7_NEZVI|nr:unnamed protein product [Nezara viridula]